MSTKPVAVVISGCGVFDGAEITETVLLNTHLAKNGCEVQFFAPDQQQHHVINHITGEEMEEQRNVLVEAARIARGKVLPLSELNPDKFAGLAFPGGFGAAKTFSKFAFDGPEGEIDGVVKEKITAFHGLGKPILSLCITPVLLAKSIPGLKLTLGEGQGEQDALKAMGAEPAACPTKSHLVDTEHRVVTSPCYMHDATILEIDAGIEGATKAFRELLG